MKNPPECFKTAKFIKQINKIYHDIEASHYNNRHPEILNEERVRWGNLIGMCLSKIPKNPTVLDIGSGTGFTVQESLHQVKSGTFILSDISRQMLRTTKSRLRGKTRDVCFIQSDAEVPAFKKTTFDLITVNSVVHHLPSPEEFIRETSELLKPGGILIINHEPNSLFYTSTKLNRISKYLKKIRTTKNRYIYTTKHLLTKYFGINKYEYSDINTQTIEVMRNIKLIDQSTFFDPKWVTILVDYHVPSPCIETGRSPLNERIQNNSHLKRLYFNTYNCLSDESSKSIFNRIINRILERIYPHSGAHFTLILYNPPLPMKLGEDEAGEGDGGIG
jgi:ubiquinone/menaquinone biosynthesis C-methylase UbiE